jgi:aspartokinase
MLTGASTNDAAELKIQDLRLHGAVEDLARLGNVDLMADMAILSLVGKQLKNTPGISGKFFTVLGENNIVSSYPLSKSAFEQALPRKNGPES